MATASDMILSSLIMIGDKIIGGSLTSAEQTHWLARLNTFMESLSLNRLNCYQLVEENFSLVAGTTSYTIGSGGTFNTTRPNKICDPCFTRDSSSIDSALEIVDAITYGRLRLKSLGNAYPGYLFYDSAYVSGLATIKIYPAPLSGLTLYINSWKQLQTFAAMTTVVSLPPGYQLAIESNFAIFAAAGFRKVSAEVIKVAQQSMAAVEALNAPDMIMRTDGGRGESSSILTG